MGRDHLGNAANTIKQYDAEKLEELRATLKKAPGTGQVEVDGMSDAELVDAAQKAGEWEKSDLPAGDERSDLEQYLEEQRVRQAESEGLDTEDNPLDVETQVAHVEAASYGKQRELAESIVKHRNDVDDPSDLADADLYKFTGEEAQKQLLGAGYKNPNDLETYVEQLRASKIGRLVEQHGFAREDLNDLSLDELTSLEAEQGPSNDDGSDLGGEAGVDHGDRTGTDVYDGIITENVGDSEGKGDSDTGVDAEGGVTSWFFGGDGHTYTKDADGDWTDEVGFPASSEVVRQIEDEIEQYGPASETVVDEARDPNESYSREGFEDETSNGNDSSNASTGDAAQDDSSGSNDDSDDDDGSDDDGSDDDDDDGTGDDADSTAEDVTDEEDGEEQSESSGGNSADGTPNPLGDNPVDPAAQARFDDSPFGRQQRAEQIDAIEDRGGHTGSPDDDPSDFDTATFLDTPVGVEMAETTKGGIDQRRDGGDTDPADLDAVESVGPVIELKVSGGGVSDPVDEPTPSFGDGDGGRGAPIPELDPVIGGPPPSGIDRLDDAHELNTKFEEVDPFDGLDTHHVTVDVEEFDSEVDIDVDIEVDLAGG